MSRPLQEPLLGGLRAS